MAECVCRGATGWLLETVQVHPSPLYVPGSNPRNLAISPTPLTDEILAESFCTCFLTSDDLVLFPTQNASVSRPFSFVLFIALQNNINWLVIFNTSKTTPATLHHRADTGFSVDMMNACTFNEATFFERL